MPKENTIPMENKKPVAEVRWGEYQEVKKSSLSPVARNKVINKSGSNYVSENGAKVAGDIEKVVSLFKDAGYTCYEAKEHVNHLRNGHNYKSGCRVCNA